jgi:iron-sulfur cluster assembly protein
MITLTENAASRVQVLLASQNIEGEGAGLRVFVKAGGCAGFEYGFDLEKEIRENDYTFDMHGVRVYLDPKSALYLAGTEIDYEETLMATGFKVNNPNAQSTCGCGTSFSV